MPHVTMLIDGLSLRVEGAYDYLGGLGKELTCTKKNQLRGWEARRTGQRVQIEEIPLFVLEGTTIKTWSGFVDRIRDFLTNYGVTCEIGYAKLPHYMQFRPDISNMVGTPRAGQLDMLSAIMSFDKAQLNGCTGLGKSWLIKQICRIYAQEDCRIVVSVPQAPNVNRLYRDLVEDLGDEQVGHVKRFSAFEHQPRIMVTTTQSLHKIDPFKVDIMLQDEVHGVAAPSMLEKLRAFPYSRMYGFSATTECRTDGADILVESLFGPVRTKVSLEDGMAEGYVPEVEAYFYEITVPPSIETDDVRKHRELVWGNASYNADVAAVARYWEAKVGAGAQVLIMTNALEHVLRLWAKLPEYTIIYASADTKQLQRFHNEGLLPQGFTPLSGREKDRLVQQFERGELKRVIATTTMGVGVDAPGLDVIIRADGTSSEISNVQYRGRVTRGETGIYCDFLPVGDLSDKTAKGRGEVRMRSAKRGGWPVHRVSIGEIYRALRQ